MSNNKRVVKASKTVSIVLYILSFILLINCITCVFGRGVLNELLQPGITTEMFLWKGVLYPSAVLLLAVLSIVTAIIIRKKVKRNIYIAIGVVAAFLLFIIIKAILAPNSCTNYGGFNCLNW